MSDYSLKERLPQKDGSGAGIILLCTGHMRHCAQCSDIRSGHSIFSTVVADDKEMSAFPFSSSVKSLCWML